MKLKKTKVKQPNIKDNLDNLVGTEGEKIAQSFLEQDNQLIDEAIGTLKDTTQLGQETLTELEKQGEQLKGIDSSINDIRRENHENKKQLRQVKSIFGGLINRLTGCFHREIKDEWPDKKPTHQKSKHKKKSNHSSDHAQSPAGQTPLYDLYKKNEQGLGQVDSLTQGLNDLASQMGSEIDLQNEQLDRIFANADKALEEIRKNKKTANETLL